MAINICVIPAAGRATRWLPISYYLPKDLLPLTNRPVIEWVLDEAIESGCKKVIIVMNKEKKILKKYLLENTDYPKRTELVFVPQNDFMGISKAMLKSKKHIGNSPFVVALPDLPTISTIPVIKQMISIYNSLKDKAHIVSFDKFKKTEARFYGECQIKKVNNNLLNITHFCPINQHSKKPHHKNNDIRMSGRFVFTPEIFPVIERLLARRVVGVEINDRSALGEAQKLGQNVVGYKIKGKTYDTGYPRGYLLAYNAFFNKFADK